MNIYVVVAFRCGGNEHVFPIGAFGSRAAAESAASDHRGQRGGKYDHRVYEFSLDAMDDDIGRSVTGKRCLEWTENYRPPPRPVVVADREGSQC